MEILYRGMLKEEIPFYIRELYLDDLANILDVQNEVVDVLENSESLATLSKEEFEFILSGNGRLLGVFADDRLIAFRSTLVPEVDNEHLGLDVGLDITELSTVIYQEISSVSPLYRGHGLQRLMAVVLMKQLEMGQFRYVCATVAPFNIPSLKDKFSQQMEIAALKEKYGGMLRYVFVKNLRCIQNVYNGERLIPMEDTVTQQKLLADGWRGTGMAETLDGWIVQYQR